jgi:hypothetical protein
MRRSSPPESTASRIGFGADLAYAARALISQPSVPLVSLAVWLLVCGDSPSAVRSVVRIASMFFLAGWLGVERVFFQRHLQGRPVPLPHLLRLVKPFLGRFLMLGFWFGITSLAVFFSLARVTGMDFNDSGAPMPLSLQVGMAAIAVANDFALTFVPPALAYTTRSAWRAVGIGVAMIRQTWPRSALYVLCPPLALNFLHYIFPVGGLVLQSAITFVVTLVGLLAKGAIAAFYLRERGSYSQDGAAYIGIEGETASLSPASG